MTVPQPNTPNM